MVSLTVQIYGNGGGWPLRKPKHWLLKTLGGESAANLHRKGLSQRYQ